MEDFTKVLPFIIFFLVLVLLFNMMAGDKMTTQFLVLVLASMVVMNTNEIKGLVEGVFKVE